MRANQIKKDREYLTPFGPGIAQQDGDKTGRRPPAVPFILAGDRRRVFVKPRDVSPPAPATDSSASTHSPGPWSMTVKGGVAVWDSDDSCVCAMAHQEDRRVTVANGTVIAASPTMLAALRRVDALIGHLADLKTAPVGMVDGPDVARDVRAAIARATP